MRSSTIWPQMCMMKAATSHHHLAFLWHFKSDFVQLIIWYLSTRQTASHYELQIMVSKYCLPLSNSIYKRRPQKNYIQPPSFNFQQFRPYFNLSVCPIKTTKLDQLLVHSNKFSGIKKRWHQLYSLFTSRIGTNCTISRVATRPVELCNRSPLSASRICKGTRFRAFSFRCWDF
jgi:hypothetical protein